MTNKGHEFKSDTDSEVVIHFIEDIRKNSSCDLDETVRLAMKKIFGAYAIVILDQKESNLLIAIVTEGDI